MIVAAPVESYLESLRPARDAVLGEMEALAREKSFPIVGPEVGRLLQLLVGATGARAVLELGSGFGYSAYWMASALPPGGRILCTDLLAENRERALGYLRRGGLASRVDFQVGDALALLDAQAGPFDLVFNDVDKQSYPVLVERVVARLRPGGLFVTDNTLWKGRVAEEGAGDEQTRAIREFNQLTANHPELSTVILPLRDGVSLCLRR